MIAETTLYFGGYLVLFFVMVRSYAWLKTLEMAHEEQEATYDPERPDVFLRIAYTLNDFGLAFCLWRMLLILADVLGVVG